MVKGEYSPSAGGPPRGIVFLGGEGPGPERCRELLREAEAAGGSPPLTAAADSGLLLAERAGIQPRWVLGDMDSLPDPETRLAPYPPETVFRYPAAKDFTDAELALSLLWDRGGGEIWLAGGGGGRTDHLLGIRSLFERDRSPARWITAAEDIRCVEGGGPLPAELTFPGGGSPAEPGPARVSVFPLGAGPWEAESEGLRWPLGGLPWDRGFFGLSNEAPLGSFTIRAVRGRFLAVIAVEGGAVTALGFT